MSLGIALKAAGGIVLAADSRVTLNRTIQSAGPTPTTTLIPATFDNATKLLSVPGQPYVGAVTFGLGALGQAEPRTAASFLPEFDKTLAGLARLSVEEFAAALSDFYMGQWKRLMPAGYAGDDMIFLVGGYDDGAAYGRVFSLSIPKEPAPLEQFAGDFGAVWGGQRAYADRLMNGFDDATIAGVRDHLGLNPSQVTDLITYLKQHNPMPIPYQFLPLQDCVDLCVALVRSTINMQRFIIDVRGVGGPIDVATVTPADGFRPVQQKEIRGERP